MLYLYKVNLLNIQMEKNNYPGSMKFVLKIKKIIFYLADGNVCEI